jgi:alpha-D-xyloside xylohydrolase
VGYYKARNRSVYFPKQSGWYDLYTGRHIQGGQRLVVDAPYERIPVFVREGSIIPYGPEMQYTGERPADDITLYVYAGRNAQFQLYEDEGTNYNYEKGRYATIDIRYDDASRTLTIDRQNGRYDGMPKQRQFSIVLVTPDSPRALDFQPQQAVQVTYTGKQLTVKL